MKLPHRRQFLHLAAGAAALPAVSQIARAQAYPSRPVRLIVGFAAGGPTDITARLTGQWLSERLGQQFIIENRPGAASNLAVEAVVRAPSDGYTLLVVGATNTVNSTLYEKLSFNLIRDIAPVATTSREPLIMVVNPAVSAKTVAEFVTHAKAHPGKINFGSGGNGTPPHVSGELFKMMTETNLVHVPYRGAAPAITDLLSGQVQVMFATPSISIEHIRASKLRPLAVTSATRWAGLPEIPTVSESVPCYESSRWYGIGAPRNTPTDIIGKLNREINAGLADPKLTARLADLGAVVVAGSPADFGRLIADETEKWAQVIRTSNIKTE
jgi:tripartite-type tricarboxylate transporter receptor subunit TctC